MTKVFPNERRPQCPVGAALGPLETGRGGGRAPLARVQCHFPHLALGSTILPADFPSATDA